MSNMTFGECLKFMLSALDISMNRLAKYINVDNSLVNRWVHGERIPPYGSSYIDNIALYMSKNVYNAYQNKNLNEIIAKHGYSNNSCDTEEKIKRILLEAQGYSFECRKRHLDKTKNSAKVQGFKAFGTIDVEVKNAKDMIQTKMIDGIFGMSSNDKVIFGSENIIKYAFNMLDEAINEDKENKIIYLTYNSNISKNNGEMLKLQSYLGTMIKNGWEIIILMKLDNNFSRILNFIRLSMPLMFSGKLNIYYYINYAMCDAEREMLIIPNTSAMSGFAHNCNIGLNAAFYLKCTSAVNAFKDHFESMMEKNAHPLIKNYDSKAYMEYWRNLVESDETIGNRMVFRSGLGSTMLPEHIYLKFLNKLNLSDDIVKFAFNNYKKQREAFQKNIKSYEYNEIYLMDAVSSLIQTNKFCMNYYAGVQHIKLEIEEIIEILENIIHNIKKYKHYKISFINRKIENLITAKNFSFVLKERKALFYESYNDRTNYPSIRLSIEEPTFIKAFEEYFMQVWEHITPANKEKSEAIMFLKRHIEALKRQA
ncbi:MULTISPECIES: helix-turn-helix domain-containing protein [unclassified Sedimentibacter]|uniref:helix-turn-helix domain-containing protein n=1 Tax=unclassified Sedimentibacter TaxID=2649220 RepID=UPI0027E176DA|nr:helix-turn-helix transcriptional regulator [Sedimentibacter sp. MB35-C1]WMJ77749.1 helix-turn-helix transcriptional regulator [Sedimentibacter sp. MB35-C1]